MSKAYIRGIASYLPQSILDNQTLAAQYPQWSLDKIGEKTGISSRHIIADNESVSDMAVYSAEKLLRNCNLERSGIDYILLCTQSPDYLLPTTACIVQDRLGLPTSCGALDFNLGCSGYVYGLSLAKGLIESQQAKNVLLITSEAYSRYINHGDKSVRSLFGDGATSTLLSNSEKEALSSFVFGTDGSGFNNLIVPHGGSCSPISNESHIEREDKDGNIRSDKDLYMDGPQVLVFTLRVVPNMMRDILSKAGLRIEDIDFFVLHQANKFLLNRLKDLLEIPEEKFLTSYENYGNTGSSTIPLGLELDAHRFKSGDKILIMGFGVGYSWGGCVITWSSEYLRS
jgi:3-oxoacyl-[acyl-carrier-protein] synthase-3